ncbi:MAG: D-amino-acid transaminase [Paracoccaceae bacterium]|jgi:D-alanine transaminase|nr:D-amino-acid transaminase [Paracoccaceae bacterium]MDG1940135.1 D-amino-acid transaminase [Paracoccaceae bacterium]|tara:strand:- start:14114 stop:14965 length:852 start_codon:yes stop_codon:yes gene_type:complete
MSRIVYVNGEYVSEESAVISVFDRGFLMADAVYEVTSVLDGKLLEFDGHLKRLKRSLSELDMQEPDAINDLLEIHRTLVRDNQVDQGGVYLQVTRGVADRDFIYPENVKSTLVMFTQSKDILGSKLVEKGMKVISIDDLRWGRRDIKTVQLLYPSMGKMMAKSAKCDDAWMVEDGFVTEGTSNNAYIVVDNKIITRELSNDILHGITRNSVLRYAEEAQMEIEERPFSVKEVLAADEAFITSASTFVMPVVEIDGEPIGEGRPGRVSRRLREIYIEESRKRAI